MKRLAAKIDLHSAGRHRQQLLVIPRRDRSADALRRWLKGQAAYAFRSTSTVTVLVAERGELVRFRVLWR
jgi:hypothetical protein